LYFDRNMALLEKENPGLREKIQDIEIDSNYLDILPIDGSSNYTCRASYKENGYKILLHSIVDPSEEAISIVNTVEGLDKNYFLCVIGFGFGYYVRELAKRKLNRGKILVIEPRLDIFKAAISNIDFTDLFKANRIIILEHGANFKANLTELLRVNVIFMRNTILFQQNSYENIINNKLSEIRKEFYDSIKFIMLGIGDAPGDTLVGIINSFNNIKFVIESFNIFEISDTYKGVPAIIVSAGPSLDKNFQLLKQVKGKALIIAAETIQEKLLNNGIVPDIVSVLERGNNVYEDYFKDKELCKDVILFGQILIDKEVFSYYPGKKVVCLKSGPDFETMVSKSLEGMNTFSAGQSVANMNFSIAKILGCNPIILIGQDLCYGSDGKTHAKDTITENETFEDQKEENSTYFKEEYLMKIKGNSNETVVTNRYWYQFLKWFEMAIESTDAQVINATEGGAFITGAKIMDLKSVIEYYCDGAKTILKLNDEIKDVDEEVKRIRMESLKISIEKEIEGLKAIKGKMNEALMACNEIIDGNIKTPEELVKNFEIIRDRKLKLEKTSVIFACIIQAPRIMNIQKDTEIIDINTSEAILQWSLEQKEFYNDMLKILGFTNKIFSYGYKKLCALMENTDISFFDTEEIVNSEGV